MVRKTRKRGGGFLSAIGFPDAKKQAQQAQQAAAEKAAAEISDKTAFKRYTPHFLNGRT